MARVKTEKSDAPQRKKRRWRNGTVSLRNIRFQQKQTGPMIRKVPFRRMLVEIVEKQDAATPLRFQDGLVRLVRAATEEYLVELLRQGFEESIQAKRVSLEGADIDRVRSRPGQI